MMTKNLHLAFVLIFVSMVYALCGLFLNSMGASLFLSWLFWNLFLAVLPVVIAICAQLLMNTTKKWNILILFLGIIWLLFLPNACYMVTDLIHLDTTPFIAADGTYLPHMVAWIQLFYIVSSVFLALTCGLFSTHIMQETLPFQHPLLQKLWVLCICILNGFGVYMGRFLRLNSWDILHPFSLIHKIIENFNGFTVMFTMMLAVFYGVAYWIFKCIIQTTAQK